MRSVSSGWCCWLLLLLFGQQAPADPVVLNRIRELILAHHITPPDPTTFELTSIDDVNPVLRTLDPYSVYLPAENEDAIESKAATERPGIGIDLLPSEGAILVIPRKGGTLYSTGIHDQQQLVSVNDRPVDGMTLRQIGDLLQQGAADSAVLLGIRENSTVPTQVLSLKPELFTRLPVEVVEDDVQPYIRIHSFAVHQTRRLVADAIRSLMAANDVIVLDLRYAGGGDLFEALDTASLFLSGGEQLVTIVDARGHKQTYHSLPAQQIVMSPIIILTGPSTASASEVLVRALHRYGVAILVGGVTYGKCLSQREWDLPDGSRLRLSNQKILDTAGDYCEGSGIKPDVLVDNSDIGDTRSLLRRGLLYRFKTAVPAASVGTSK